MKNRSKKRCFPARLRSNRGSVSAAGLAVMALAVLMVFSFAFDVGHNVLVRSQLQSAADAAALAGAYDICLSGGNGNPTLSPAQALTYAALANQDALYIAEKNSADGPAIQDSDVSLYPCQYCNPPRTASSGYSSNYYMTVTIQKRITNWLTTLIGRPFDTVTVTAVAGPVGSASNPTTSIAPFPFAIYSPYGALGTQLWTQDAGTNTLDVGILPLLTNFSTSQFVSGPTGLLGGTLAVAGAGGNGNPTLQMMKYFDPSQTTSIGPPSLTVGQTLLLMNPGVTGLNLTPLQAGPLTVEHYFQTGNPSDPGFLGLLAGAPSYTPQLASFLQGKTFMVPVVSNPNVPLLGMPLASILLGGVGAQVKGFVPVQFSAGKAQTGTGLTLLGIVVLPPNFQVSGTVQPPGVPANIGLVL